MKRYSAHAASSSASRIGRARDVRLAAVAELGLVARAAPRAADEQHQCATRGGAVLVDQRAGREALERERRVASGCGSPLRDRLGEDLARAGRRLEAAGAPAAS